MATIRQIEANRRNALASTGPRTEHGKAVSRMNALKSGIDAKASVIRDERPADLEALTFEYHDRFHPQAPEERFLVDSLIGADWLLRRLRKAEAQTWEQGMDSVFELDKDNPLGQIAVSRATIFSRLQRRLDSTDRTYHRALDRLQRLQAAQPAITEPAPLHPHPEIGFVPSPPDAAPPADAPPPAPPDVAPAATPIGFVPLESQPHATLPPPIPRTASKPAPIGFVSPPESQPHATAPPPVPRTASNPAPIAFLPPPPQPQSTTPPPLAPIIVDKPYFLRKCNLLKTWGF